MRVKTLKVDVGVLSMTNVVSFLMERDQVQIKTDLYGIVEFTGGYGRFFVPAIANLLWQLPSIEVYARTQSGRTLDFKYRKKGEDPLNGVLFVDFGPEGSESFANDVLGMLGMNIEFFAERHPEEIEFVQG